MFSYRISLRSFIVLHFTSRSMVYFELIFAKSKRSVPRFVFSATLIFSCSALFVEKMIFSPLYCLCSSAKNRLMLFMWVYFWVLCSGPLIQLSVLLPILPCTYYCSFAVSLEVEWSQSSDLVLLLPYGVDYPWAFASPHTLQNQCAHKVAWRDYEGSCLEPTTQRGMK